MKLKRPREIDINPNIGKVPFYLLNLTWGLPVNIGGAITAAGLLATGHKPKKYGDCIQFDVGKDWGGGSMGLFMFTGSEVPERVKEHEHGHSVQNCYFGPFMPFVVNIPSSARFWYRKAIEKIKPDIKLPPYDSAWFEGQASALGHERMENRREE